VFCIGADNLFEAVGGKNTIIVMIVSPGMLMHLGIKYLLFVLSRKPAKEPAKALFCNG
jgi:hypothetical protein